MKWRDSDQVADHAKDGQIVLNNSYVYRYPPIAIYNSDVYSLSITLTYS